MAENKDYPLRFLEIIAVIIKRRKERGLYSREVKQKRLEVKPKLSTQNSSSIKDNSLKISNVVLKKKKLPKKKNKYILIQIPKEKKVSKKKKFSSKNSKLFSSKKTIKKRQSNKTSGAKNRVTKTQNIITLEPYINAQPKNVTLSLNGVKQDSDQNKSDIPIKHPLEKIILNELDSSPKKQKKKKTKKITASKKSTQNKSSTKTQLSKAKKRVKKTDSESKSPLKLKSSSKKGSKQIHLQEKLTMPNKEELLSKINSLETWMSKVKGTVNDKTMKNLEEKLSSLKSKVSKMK